MSESVNFNASVEALKANDKDLEGAEKRLADELAVVKGQRKAIAKALVALTGSATGRRRGRPRGSSPTASS